MCKEIQKACTVDLCVCVCVCTWILIWLSTTSSCTSVLIGVEEVRALLDEERKQVVS